MTLIYSNTAIDKIQGLYIAPRFFDESFKPNEKVDLVYTDDDKIKSFYENQEIEVKRITQNQQVVEVNRESLLSQALELGLEFKPNINNKALILLTNEALKAKQNQDENQKED